MVSRDLVQWIAEYRRASVADEENSLPLWQKAARLTMDQGPQAEDRPGETETIGQPATCGIEQDAQGAPQGEVGDPLLALVQQHGEALRLVDEGIERGKLQFPEVREPEEWHRGTELFQPLGHLSSIRSMMIRRLVADGDYGQAVAAAIRMLHIGDMICYGDGIVVHYMGGCCFRGMARESITYLASQNPPAAIVRGLLAAVEETLDSRYAAARAMIADFRASGLAQVERMPDSRTLEELIDCLLNEHYSPDGGGILEDRPISDAEERVRARRQCMIQLLAGHPRPFDKKATVHLMHEQLAADIGDLDEPERPKLTDLPGRLRSWRRQLAYRRENKEIAKWPKQLRPMQAWHPLGDDDLAKARSKLVRVPNPVGLLAAAYSRTTSVRSILRRDRSEMQACRDLLSLQQGG